MNDQSSATMATDPDRLLIEQFEQGTSSSILNAKKIERLNIAEQDPIGSATFVIRNEDHTLGNLLRWMIMQDPEVEYCGYSVPHPSEAKIHLRIQSSNGTPAVDILNRALDKIIDLSHETISLYEAEISQWKSAGKGEQCTK